MPEHALVGTTKWTPAPMLPTATLVSGHLISMTIKL